MQSVDDRSIVEEPDNYEAVVDNEASQTRIDQKVQSGFESLPLCVAVLSV